MKSKNQIIRQQQDWANNSGINFDSRGYVHSVDQNLFQGMSANSHESLTKSYNAGLKDPESTSYALKSLLSSHILRLNVFDYWIKQNDRSPLRNALGFQADIESVDIEKLLNTGLKGTPPHLSVLITDTSGNRIAMYCPFTEWLQRKVKLSKLPFSISYFTPKQVWEDQELPKCQVLAKSIQDNWDINKIRMFQHLKAPKLLKDILSLANKYSIDKFSYWYVHYDYPGIESKTLAKEIDQFGEKVDDCLNFKAISYQELFCSIKKYAKAEDQEYTDYLGRRYFPNV